jgi:ferritin
MLSGKMGRALDRQINAELYSAYLYLSMAAWSESQGLDGFGNWFRIQAQEELAHAMRFYGYVCGRGGRVALSELAAPPAEWDSPLSVFEDTLKHEQKVTGLINGLVDLARSESDHATDNMLRWFVVEQVEEESTADELRRRVQLAGGKGRGLQMIDAELASRVFTPPAQEED